MRRLLLRALAALPEPARDALRQVRQHSRLVRRLTEPVSRKLRSSVFVVESGAAAGLRMNTSEGKLGYVLGENEPEVQEALEDSLAEGDVFYDIGANIGFFTLVAARLVGPAGKVYAFEPLPQLAQALRGNVSLNGFENVVVLTVAAHSRNGMADLDIGDGTTAARVVTTSTSPSEIVPVELRRVDDLMSAGELTPPSVIKIDVEGAEEDVLGGMANTVAEHRPVMICELHGPQDGFLTRLEQADYEIAVLDDGKGVDNPHIIARPR
jgi:FkbM family methyltransferase